jgi:hypothetical protein
MLELGCSFVFFHVLLCRPRWRYQCALLVLILFCRNRSGDNGCYIRHSHSHTLTAHSDCTTVLAGYKSDKHDIQCQLDDLDLDMVDG